MATSGLYTLGLTFNEFAIEVFDLLQIGEDGETLDGDMKARCKRSLNLRLKEMQGQGIHLWAYTEGTLFLTVGQSEYDLSSAKCANTWYETTTTADTAAGANSFDVTSADNIQANDVIGIIQSDNDIFWTTVANVSTLTITTADNITLATSSGAKVRNYRPSTATSPALKPISRVLDVRRKDTDSEIPILFESRQDYFNNPDKTTNGTVIQAYYERSDIAGGDNGKFYVWNPSSSSVPYLNFTYERKIQKVDQVTETLDIPEQAQLYLIYQTAVDLIPKYGCSPARAAWIKGELTQLKNDFLAFDGAVYPIKLKMRRYG